MSVLEWDKTGAREYETGVKKGVLYVQEDGAYPVGVPWNGLSAVTESPSGAEPNAVYADDIKYLNLVSAEEFAATVEAYMSPPEFDACDGSLEVAPGVTVGQQDRKAFGMSYVTTIGNDTKLNNYGYKIHLIWGAIAAPSEKAYNTVNESPEAMGLSWELSTTPVSVKGGKPTATMVINSTKTTADKLKAIEDILYGTADTEARLPLPDEIISIMKGETAEEDTTGDDEVSG